MVTAEKAGFEDHIVAWRSLRRFGRRRRRRAGARPVVPSEHNSGEVDFMRKLEEPFECGCPRIERYRPWFYVCDVFKTACQRLQQFLLLS